MPAGGILGPDRWLSAGLSASRIPTAGAQVAVRLGDRGMLCASAIRTACYRREVWCRGRVTSRVAVVFYYILTVGNIGGLSVLNPCLGSLESSSEAQAGAEIDIAGSQRRGGSVAERDVVLHDALDCCILHGYAPCDPYGARRYLCVKRTSRTNTVQFDPVWR